MFRHRGLQNESIRNDLVPYLQQQTCSDVLLIEKLNIACANEADRQHKRRQLAQPRPFAVHVAQTDDQTEEKRNKEPARDPSNRTQPEILKELRSDLASLKTQHSGGTIQRINPTASTNAPIILARCAGICFCFTVPTAMDKQLASTRAGCEGHYCTISARIRPAKPISPQSMC